MPSCRLRGIAAAGGLALGLALSTPAATAAQSALPQWMAGCWTGGSAGARVTERWTVAGDAAMFGVSYTLKGGALVDFEFLRVVLKAGTPVYVAQPRGGPPTEFTASSNADGAIVFENAAHDFPKRIGYRKVDGTHLTAWIDGGAGGSGRRIEYPMARAACEP
ncbi:MAG: DUF6265 family protein [Vicinamibacterales bacterium]